MPCQIDLPAVTYQYLTFPQSLWMEPAHHFAHCAGLDINSSHCCDLSPTLLQKRGAYENIQYENTWMSLQSLSHVCILHIIDPNQLLANQVMTVEKDKKNPETQRE